MNVQISKEAFGKREVVVNGELPAEESDEEQQKAKLQEILERLSKEKDINLEELRETFQQCNCNVAVLEDYLTTKDKSLLWNPIEDLALKQEPDTAEYQYLLTYKGEDACNERREFLGIDDDDEEESVQLDQEIVMEAASDDGQGNDANDDGEQKEDIEAN